MSGKRQKRTIKVTKIGASRRPDGSVQYRTTIPAWIVEKVLESGVGDKIEWDFLGPKAIITKKE